ncbi:hypothetical protein [Pinibacter aurantiacus]|uniref:Uncharacterized protein n=1 Tax=Pinibacter aurantiacus TaxID=2851599 RepID=A0A9E2SFP7_9BACT|nr:hypothetical protein [Pinibacter aurantiacus]MBV4360599.1 hypothetical protein [Pinibacter aurantiacus]
MDFNKLYWHDSVINSVSIDRTEPGKKDTICFEINWYEEGINILLFEDVYWLGLDMNFGVVAKECIDQAYIAERTDNDLIRIEKIWEGIISEPLNCYVIKTASTGSVIKIIAKGFTINNK